MLPKRMLFRFSTPCLHCNTPWRDEGAGLGPEHRLPNLAALEGRAGNVEVFAGWNAEGMAFSIRVSGKKQPTWCRTSRTDDSDGVQFWIDTRDVHNVHRASRFCHRFLFLPTGGGQRSDQPWGQWLPINRARQHPDAIAPGQVKAKSILSADGYRLDVFLAAAALTGFDPAEHPRLGFQYAVVDRELGESTFAVGSPMPYQEDPSLWATLELASPI